MTAELIDKTAEMPLKAPCSRAVFGPRSVSRPVVHLLGLRGGSVGAGGIPGAQEGAFPQI
jgi:hypothetical protein